MSFVGVDLSVANAQATHDGKFPNLRFVKGYTLDLLQSDELRGDLVFGSSTFVVMAPREFAAVLAAMKGTRRLIISDPVTFGNRHDEHDRPMSRHMDLYMWWHNYRGYLKSAGWKVETIETVTYSYPHNPNCSVVLVDAVPASG